MKKFAIIGGAVLFLILVTLVWSYSANYETAKYKMESKDGDYEIRAYPDIAVVSAATGEDRNGGFMKLFRYIDKDNENEKKIAMTTPVFDSMKGEGDRMYFVLPSEYQGKDADIPAPKSPEVKVETIPGGKFAVYRYSGVSREADRVKALEALKTWVESKGLTVKGDPLWAGYNPPWTPGPLRRNEVLLRVE